MINVVRAATGLGLKEAKVLVDEAPEPVKEGIEKAEADKLKADNEEAGGSVELKWSRAWPILRAIRRVESPNVSAEHPGGVSSNRPSRTLTRATLGRGA